MPSPARFLCLVLLALFCPPAGAQPPSYFPDAAGVIPSEWLSAPAPPTTSHTDGPCFWHVDLLLGFPLGLRAQRALGEGPWLVEGFVGLAALSPTAGVGARRQWALLEGNSNVLMVNPGIDAYLSDIVQVHSGGLFGPSISTRGGGALVADVDLVWRHTLAGGGESQLGLKVGGGPCLGVKGTVVLPVVALYFGWGF